MTSRIGVVTARECAKQAFCGRDNLPRVRQALNTSPGFGSRSFSHQRPVNAHRNAVALSQPASPRTISNQAGPRPERHSNGGNFGLAHGAAAIFGVCVALYASMHWPSFVHLDSPKAIRGTDTAMSASDLISMDEVAKHDSPDKGIWVVIQGQVYDLTDFVQKHPGGAKIIMKNAGKDVTDLFMPVHPKNAIRDSLSPNKHIGAVDPATVKEVAPQDLSDRELRRRAALENLPPVGTMLCLDDFEYAARAILTDQAWGYMCSAGDDEITKHQNRSSYGRIWFKPRILRAVGQVDTRTNVFGAPSTLPFYISPAALAKLGHPDGELNLTRAAGVEGIVQGISANASVGLDEMLDVRQKDQALVYQLYVNKDRAESEKILRKLEDPKSGMRAVLLTVDAPVMGNREGDQRAKGEAIETGGGHGGDAGQGKGVASAVSGYIDPNLTWDIVGWYKQNCKLPLLLKGVQSVEDVALAKEHGCAGVILSNHGGRSLDYAPAPIDVLVELYQTRPDLIRDLDIYVDGGVRRGTDVLKALALGAKGVGLGRPFLFAQSGFGQAGAQRAIQILRDEIERDMRLMGITSLRQLGPHMIDILPRSYDPYLLHRQQERLREYPFEAEQKRAWSGEVPAAA